MSQDGYRFRWASAFKDRGYPELAVRNIAALELAQVLRVEVPLDPDRGALPWMALRAVLRQLAQRELARLGK